MATKKSASREIAAKNAPLVEDIRLLGRILGDVIREQEGQAAFDLVERVRQLSVAYRLKRDARAGHALDRLLMGLSGDRTVSVIRAFSYFSHLANIAEDRHHLRRRAVHERQGHLQRGSLATAFERLARRGVHADAIAETLAHAFISPVLTAHPTEVQRKSILDAERAIAELLAARTPDASARELARNEALLRGRVTQLWQTRMLRNAKLTVDDEIENALSYYRSTFLEQIPVLYREIEEVLPGHRDRAVLSHGQLDRRRPRRQPQRLRRHPCHGAGAAERNGAALVPDAGARAGRGAVELGDADGSHAGAAGPCRRLRRQQPAPRRRALPARPDRHVRAPGGDPAAR